MSTFETIAQGYKESFENKEKELKKAQEEQRDLSRRICQLKHQIEHEKELYKFYSCREDII